MRDRVAEVLRRLCQEQPGATHELTRLLAAPDGVAVADELRQQLGGLTPEERFGFAVCVLLVVETEPELGGTLIAETRLGHAQPLPGGDLLHAWARRDVDLVVSGGVPPA